MSRNGKHSFQAEVFALIEEQLGHNNLLTVPTALIRFCGDLDESVFLSQLIYWADKGKREDGYVFKSKTEWEVETGLRRFTFDRIVRKLKRDGLLKVKLRQANGNPTLHYQLDRKAFMDAFSCFLLKGADAICRNQPIDKLKTTNGLVGNNHSITDTTTEPSSYPTLSKEGKKGASARQASRKHYTSSFKSWKKRNNPDPEIADGIDYFLFQHESKLGTRHPRLRDEQWRVAVDAFSLMEDEFGSIVDITSAEEIKAMTNKYFRTEYQDGCDYRLMHFTSNGILLNLYWDAIYHDR